MAESVLETHGLTMRFGGVTASDNVNFKLKAGELRCLIGPNGAGKSTFFNRIIGKRLAIVDDQPGVTRDRNFARADWAGREFYIVDTGGVIEGSDDRLDRSIREQAMHAVDEADVIMFLVDGKAGVHPLDERLAEELEKKMKTEDHAMRQ